MKNKFYNLKLFNVDLVFLRFGIKMSQVRVHTLIGDSNIRQHLNQTSRRASAAIKAAQFIPCGNAAIFEESLKNVRGESSVCIVSCLSNFIASITEGPESITQRIEPVLSDAQAALLEVCAAAPTRQYVVSPPMYRTSPVWYREGLPEILTLFSQLFSTDRPENLHILSSFPIGYDPRPVLRIVPAASAPDSDRRAKSYNYVEAVTKFPTNFSAQEIDPIIKRINPEFLGKIRSTFIIISDDRYKQLTKISKPPRTTSAPEATPPEDLTEAVSDSEMSEPNPTPSDSRGTRKRVASTTSGTAPKR